MSFISFSKITHTGSPDYLRINTDAVLYVEASRPDLIGLTTIHMLGQDSAVNAVTASIDTVVNAIGGLVAGTQHYLAPMPDTGPSTLYILPANVSYVRPNTPADPEFWYVKFVDGSQVRLVDPLPTGL